MPVNVQDLTKLPTATTNRGHAAKRMNKISLARPILTCAGVRTGHSTISVLLEIDGLTLPDLPSFNEVAAWAQHHDQWRTHVVDQ